MLQRHSQNQRAQTGTCSIAQRIIQVSMFNMGRNANLQDEEPDNLKGIELCKTYTCKYNIETHSRPNPRFKYCDACSRNPRLYACVNQHTGTLPLAQ